MTMQVPLEKDYFRLPSGEPGDLGALLGSYSPQTGKYFYPRRKLCPITSGPVEDCELPARGILYSWTYVKDPRMGTLKMGDQSGYGVGQIDLPGGVRIQSIILGQQGDWEIGMPMRLAFQPVKMPNKRLDDNIEHMTFCFEPDRA